jgi:integrase
VVAASAQRARPSGDVGPRDLPPWSEQRPPAPTGFDADGEGEDRAWGLLKRVRDKVLAGEALGDADLGPLTVARWSERWLEKRRALLPRWRDDDTHLRVHVLPVIGSMRLGEVRPRHLADLVEALRLAGKAPRTVRNVYSTCRSLFRDAALADLISSSPCILGKYQLGTIRDKDPEWRASAVYSRTEVEALISDDRLPLDHRVQWAVLALAGLRYGELAGLRWRHLDFDAKPLGRMTVATSYDTGRTKTGVERRVPIHPTLAAMLAEWRLAGWPVAFGRQPGPDDRVLPVTAAANRGRRRAAGSMRDKHYIRHRLLADLALLGFRQRRGHDLRRTFVSLAREDGAAPDVLRLATHAPSSDMLDLYTSVPWERLCGEVAKLRIERRKPAEVLELHSKACCNALLHPEEEGSKVKRLDGGGAGNRTRVRRTSSEGPYARIPE